MYSVKAYVWVHDLDDHYEVTLATLDSFDDAYDSLVRWERDWPVTCYIEEN